MVAVALEAVESTDTESVKSPPTAPRVTVNVSGPSTSASSVMGMLMVWVALAAEPAAKVTVPEVAPRSAAVAVSVLEGADHATVVSVATSPDSVTVKSALAPSATWSDGPAMLSVAVSLSVRSMVSGTTSTPVAVPFKSTVALPLTTMVSSPSTTVSPTGVMLKVAEPVAAVAGMVTLAIVAV